MHRHTLVPRPNWQETVQSQGLTFHTPAALPPGARPYWDEAACYEFTAAEIDRLEAAANELQTMCLAAAQHVIDHRRYAELEIPAEAVPLIEWSWNEEPPALYGRFDLLYNGQSAPKLLEYNADTPTSLLEAAVIQWNWLRDTHPDADQFNSLHERLIAKWKDLDPYLSKPVYFASTADPEDQLTVAYLRDTAEQAGLKTRQLLMEEIGWNERRNSFVDNTRYEDPIRSLFKLYPWETLLEEAFAPQCLRTYKQMRWIEPIWKLLLSNKGILPILWQLYPNHDLLLEARFSGSDAAAPLTPGWIRKPLHSREGANITLATPDGRTHTTPGPYTNRLHIDQRLGPATCFADAQGAERFPVLGLWMIDQECGGMGIREDPTPITGNLSSFIPHFFR
ncbi:MAG TPA: glutathionylspermidine synthase family protein [Acidobacteriaceae bacterium]|nr:glutathionylspermidine synthase family protein [Acidobacteriaceae bacterium]